MEKLKLYAPKAYWETPENELKQITGGCGPGGIGDWLVPDTMYGLSVFKACQIHDFMYAMGETNDDKEEADRVFKNNLIRIIKHHGGILKSLRIIRAHTYYLSVKWFGGPAFWDNKNKDDEFRTVTV